MQSLNISKFLEYIKVFFYLPESLARFFVQPQLFKFPYSKSCAQYEEIKYIFILLENIRF